MVENVQEDYLLKFHEVDILLILQNENICAHFSININFIVLHEHQPKLAVELLREPEKCFEEWNEAAIITQTNLLKRMDTKLKLKHNIHCRIYHLPGLPEVCRIFFPSNEDAGKFLQVSGTVMSISPIKLLQYQRSYICLKCKYSTIVKAEYERKYLIKQPKRCTNPNSCIGTNFLQETGLDSKYCKDFQEIKIQEQIKKLGVGSMPNTMWCTLEDDLVDSCKPGDDVTICGIVKNRWAEFSKGRKIEIDTVLKANNVQVDSNSSSASASIPERQEMFNSFWNKYSEDPLLGRDIILKSFCPQIYGLYWVKLAIATVLAGSCKVEDTTLTGVCTRPESHLLLIGDPGTGKSELLRFISKVVPRSVLTTGVGSTAAGLTVAAVMEKGEWQLEGGALVMSDGGVCCIDEFNSMKEHDRTSIHEAMEQQTISVAKAGIVCKLNTRCSVLACCNPKGNLDPSNPLCMNIALPSPLLSRFDLILRIRDTVEEEWDNDVAEYILNGTNNPSKLSNIDLWNIDILQSYFTVIKKISPKLSENAEIILSSYYQLQRKINSRNKARTTVRLLESLIRLCQGHARLMHHTEVQVIDSIYAIVLVDMAMDSNSSMLNLNLTTRSNFPELPKNDYQCLLETVLNKLQLHDILEAEVVLNKNITENVKSRFFQDKEIETQNTHVCSNVDNEKKRKPGIYQIQKISKKVKNKEIEASDVNQGNNTNPNSCKQKHSKYEKLEKFDLFCPKEDTVPCSESSDCKKDIIEGSATSSKNKNNGNSNSSKQKPSKYEQVEKYDSIHPQIDTIPCPKSNEDKKDIREVSVTSHKNISIMNLKRFKYAPRNNNKGADKTCNININTVKDDSVYESVNKTKETKNDCNNFFKDDIEASMLMPSVNDNFGIDLDFDWDQHNKKIL